MNPNPQGNAPRPGQQPIQGPSQLDGGRIPSPTTNPADVHSSPPLTQRQVTEDIINMEVLTIPVAVLEVLKSELGLAGKDVSALTSDDKQRILAAFRRAHRPSNLLDTEHGHLRTRSLLLPEHNRMPGISGAGMAGGAGSEIVSGMNFLGIGATSLSETVETEPGINDMNPMNLSSSPVAGDNGVPAPHMSWPTYMMIQGGRMMNAGPHGGRQMGMNPQIGGMLQMNNQMGPPGIPPNMTAYRQNMANMHKNNMPINSSSPGDASFNPGIGPQFNPNPGSRPMNNPAIGGQPQHRMHPSASPAPGKDGNKGGKPTDGSPRNQQTPNQGPTTPAPNHQNTTSNQGTPVGGPRAAPSPAPAVTGSLNPINQAGTMNMDITMMMGMMGINQPPPPNSSMTGGSGAGGSNAAPGTGAPGAGPGSGVGGGGAAGGAGSAIGSDMNFLGMSPMAGMGPFGTGLGSGMNPMNPSSSSAGNAGDGAGAGVNGMGGMQDIVFSHEFMQSVANILVDDLDPMVFRPDGDIDFERDFGPWFDPDVDLVPMVFRPDEDINFERDFGQWFNPEDLLDLK